jgi:hypothetical protein
MFIDHLFDSVDELDKTEGSDESQAFRLHGHRYTLYFLCLFWAHVFLLFSIIWAHFVAASGRR